MPLALAYVRSRADISCGLRSHSDPQDLFKLTGGLRAFPNGWKNKEGWGQTYNKLDEWYGVTTDVDGNVTELRLSFNHLRMRPGEEFPLGLFERLPHLEVLNHASESRTSSIDTAFLSAPPAQVLDLRLQGIGGDAAPSVLLVLPQQGLPVRHGALGLREP